MDNNSIFNGTTELKIGDYLKVLDGSINVNYPENIMDIITTNWQLSSHCDELNNNQNILIFLQNKNSTFKNIVFFENLNNKDYNNIYLQLLNYYIDKYGYNYKSSIAIIAGSINFDLQRNCHFKLNNKTTNPKWSQAVLSNVENNIAINISNCLNPLIKENKIYKLYLCTRKIGSSDCDNTFNLINSINSDITKHWYLCFMDENNKKGHIFELQRKSTGGIYSLHTLENIEKNTI